MRRQGISALFTAVACLLSAGAVPAEEADRISTWTAPPFWMAQEADAPSEDPDGPDAAQARGRTAEGRQALIAGPTALPFIALPPCRLVDTRGNAPLTGGFLPAATVRSYILFGVCAVPANAKAISLNAVVVKPVGPGFLTLWPQGEAFPPVSTLNFLGNDVIVNAAVVPLSVTGGISVALGVSGGDVVLDTNGYYASQAEVTSLNTLSGDLTLAPGSNITITPLGSTLTIASTAGAGGVTSVAGANGISASPSTGAVTVTSNATFLDTPSTIVARDDTGSFAAGSVTAFGDLNLPATNAAQTAGAVRINGLPFLHAFGSDNTFLGRQAGNGTMSGGVNTGVGALALFANTSGFNNSAFGTQALRNTTTGTGNAAFGGSALAGNVSGVANTAIGGDALTFSTGDSNTALGSSALASLTSGSGNTAIGSFAGGFLGSGSNNIYLAASPFITTESNTIRLGSGQTSAFMAGVFGQTSASGVAVLINPGGKLGTVTSSKRFKEEIVDMDSESDVLLKLRPVSFFYKPEYDPSRTRQYGLIAEEVAEVAPALAVFDENGRPETVRYHLVNAMLLNEVQKNRRLIDELRAERTELRRRLDALERRLSRSIDPRNN
jgi:hypothetical protein